MFPNRPRRKHDQGRRALPRGGRGGADGLLPPSRKRNAGGRRNAGGADPRERFVPKSGHLKHLFKFDQKSGHLLLYSGFHVALFGIDYCVEELIKSKFFVTLADGSLWFIILLGYLLGLCWRRHRRRNKTISISDLSVSTPPGSDDTTPPADIKQDIIEEDSQLSLLILHELSRLSFSFLKALNEAQNQKKKNHSFGLVIAHFATMVVEVSGTLLIRWHFGIEGHADIPDILGL